jgi:hypothetical protein
MSEGEILPGDYIAGFVDGEGCFALKFRRDVRRDRPGSPEYYYWGIEFAIELRKDDVVILELIKETLGCGKISVSKTGFARYSVNILDDPLNKIVPFFERYTLRAKKRCDFNLWKEALAIFGRNQQKMIVRTSQGFPKINWSERDEQRLRQIYLEMKNYKSRKKPWKWLKV